MSGVKLGVSTVGPVRLTGPQLRSLVREACARQPAKVVNEASAASGMSRNAMRRDPFVAECSARLGDMLLNTVQQLNVDGVVDGDEVIARYEDSESVASQIVELAFEVLRGDLEDKVASALRRNIMKNDR